MNAHQLLLVLRGSLTFWTIPEFVIDFKNGVQHKVGFKLPRYSNKEKYYLDGKETKEYPMVIVMDTKK